MSPKNSVRKVNVIQASADLAFTEFGQQSRKKRVAAYARVSTDSEEQLTSYEAQVTHYTRHIKNNPEWEFVEVYTDEGITGTNTKKRDGFNRMVADALDGKIDLILTKSVSRFARNTVDTLNTIRLLKKHGVGVFFERENVDTLGANSEVFITIMSSLAQEESNSISKNVTWGKQNSMREGKVFLPYKRFLGYRKGDDGLPQIVEEEAEIIRQIYAMFLDGKTYRTIAQYLTDQEISTPGGKTIWSVSTVTSILQNEKYKGDALLQKSYTVDFLSKTRKKNGGEMKQYYIEGSHSAIITPETFDLVQSEIKQRRSNRHRLKSDSPFAAKVICGECGGYFGSKVWYSTSTYRKHIWRCNQKYKDDGLPCNTPFIQEENLKTAFIEAFNQVLGDKKKYIAQFEELLPLLADTSPLEKRLQDIQNERDAIMGRMRRCMEENTRQVQNQEAYKSHFAAMSAEYKAAGEELGKIDNEIQENNVRKMKIRRFLDELLQTDDLVTQFDEKLWCATVESVTVTPEKDLSFLFRDGTIISVAMPKNK